MGFVSCTDCFTEFRERRKYNYNTFEDDHSNMTNSSEAVRGVNMGLTCLYCEKVFDKGTLESRMPPSHLIGVHRVVTATPPLLLSLQAVAANSSITAAIMHAMLA